MDRIKLQLYKFKANMTDKGMKYNRPIDPRTPDVLLELDYHTKTKYKSFLEIEL